MTVHLTIPGGAEPTWQVDAQCGRDKAEHFFAPTHFERKPEKDAREEQARSLCRACPVQPACLKYSLDVQVPHGIWGGLNEYERRRTLRQRAADAEERSA